jgi:hypothetical protein
LLPTIVQILGSPTYTKHAWFGAGSEGNEYAIEGYDTVNYFTENKPVKGLAEFSLAKLNSINSKFFKIFFIFSPN